MITPPKSWKEPQSHFLCALDSDWYKALAVLQNELCTATYNFFHSKNMKTLFLPVTTNSISSPMGLGSDSLPVEIELFGQKTFLADSMQFMLEYGCRYFKDGCFYLMPSFRGESADERHLCQFYHSEAEISGTLEDVICLVEEYIRYLCKWYLENCSDIINQIAGNTNHIKAIMDCPTIPRVSYEDALVQLSAINGALKKDEENNLVFITSIGEKALIETFGGAVWLTYMDKVIVPFYQAEATDGLHAKCADLLIGMGETVGCGERHSTKEEVLKALVEHCIDPDAYAWYTAMKEKAPQKTSGFGMGTERFLLWLLQQSDIRDCQILPRFNGEIFIP